MNEKCREIVLYRHPLALFEISTDGHAPNFIAYGIWWPLNRQKKQKNNIRNQPLNETTTLFHWRNMAVWAIWFALEATKSQIESFFFLSLSFVKNYFTIKTTQQESGRIHCNPAFNFLLLFFFCFGNAINVIFIYVMSVNTLRRNEQKKKFISIIQTEMKMCIVQHQRIFECPGLCVQQYLCNSIVDAFLFSLSFSTFCVCESLGMFVCICHIWIISAQSV